MLRTILALVGGSLSLSLSLSSHSDHQDTPKSRASSRRPAAIYPTSLTCHRAFDVVSCACRATKRPDDATYALAVVIIASAQQPAQPDPIVYISGGPGAPLTIYTGYQARHPYAADRDLILVDQRGMGRSEPRLCPEMQGDLVNPMLAVVEEPSLDAIAADRSVHAACRDAIRARGVDLNTFGKATTVEDFEWVRRALGIVRWNVVGESYGTTVAMTLLARHPESIRSAVLDSLNPPDAYFGMPWSARVARAREAFFAACQTNPTCSAPYPNLATLYRQAMARLDQGAPSVPLPSVAQVPGDHVRLTPSLFEEVVGRLVYYPPYYAGYPISSRRHATVTWCRLARPWPPCSRGQSGRAMRGRSRLSSVGIARSGARRPHLVPVRSISLFCRRASVRRDQSWDLRPRSRAG